MLYKNFKLGKKFSTSNLEIKELLKAWIILSLAFSFLLSGISFNNFNLGFLYTFILAAITVGFGFVLHELGHKFTAQRFGYKSEFRAFDEMLFLALIMSLFGFILAAPGATMIFSRNLKTEHNGKISIAGPLVNLILASIFFFILYIQFFDFGRTLAILNSPFNLDLPLLYAIPLMGFTINSWLALFNMIPVWLFDGAKIIKWNKIVYFLILITCLVFVFVL